MADSDTVTRRDTIIGVSATYDGRALAQARADLKKTADEMEKTSRVSLFNPQEQAIRDQVAGRVRGVREGARRERVENSIRNRVLSATASRTNNDIGPKPFGPDLPPIQIPHEIIRSIYGRTGAEQAERDARAAKLRGIRDYASQAKADGASDFGLTDADFNRGRARTGRSAGGEDQDLYHRLKKTLDPIENSFKVLAGIGATGVLVDIGRAMQGLPDAVDRYHASIREGTPVYQAQAKVIADAIPVVGELAKGFRAAYDAVYKFTPQGQAEDHRQRIKDEKDAQAKDREDIRSRRDAAREAVLNPIREAGKDDVFRRRLVNARPGSDAARTGAQVEYEKALADANKLGEGIGGLNSGQQDEVRRRIASLQTTALLERNAKLRDIEKQQRDADEAAEQSHADKIRGIDNENLQSRLQLQGRYLDAQLEQVKAEQKQEIEEARRKHSEEIKGLDFNKDKDLLAKADKRLADEESAAAARAKQKSADFAERDARDREKVQSDHEDKLSDIRTHAVSTRLRAVGDDADAERLELARGYEKQRDEIKDNLKEQLRLHKEREPELRKQAADDLTALGQGYQADSFALQKRLGRAFAASDASAGGEAGGLTGVRNAGVIQSVRDRNAEAQAELAKVSGDLKTEVKTLAGIMGRIGQALGVNI
jgi:hypothetical protein